MHLPGILRRLSYAIIGAGIVDADAVEFHDKIGFGKLKTDINIMLHIHPFKKSLIPNF